MAVARCRRRRRSHAAVRPLRRRMQRAARAELSTQTSAVSGETRLRWRVRQQIAALWRRPAHWPVAETAPVASLAATEEMPRLSPMRPRIAAARRRRPRRPRVETAALAPLSTAETGEMQRRRPMRKRTTAARRRRQQRPMAGRAVPPQASSDHPERRDGQRHIHGRYRPRRRRPGAVDRIRIERRGKIDG
jgi:hypothetical protein